MSIPSAPFKYSNVYCVLYELEEKPNELILVGDFPIAPTGAFKEFWKMERSSYGSNNNLYIKKIFVDNQIRKKAGIEIWNMPKSMACIDLMVIDHQFTMNINNEHLVMLISIDISPDAIIKNTEVCLKFDDHGKGEFMLTFSKSSNVFESMINGEKATAQILCGDTVLSRPKLHTQNYICAEQYKASPLVLAN